MPDYSTNRSSLHGEQIQRIRLAGAGAAAPTVEVGQRITVTRTGVGVYRITWSESPGVFAGLDGPPAFGGTVAADTKGMTATHGRYDATNRTLDISLWSSLFAARDLLATELMSINVIFTELTAQ